MTDQMPVKKFNIEDVLNILQLHYLNVGSDGYPKSVYQDEHLEGLSDGVELVQQAFNLAQSDPKAFQQQYLAHQYGNDKTLSLNQIKLYWMVGTYQPNLNSKSIMTSLVVHAPAIKYSHFFSLTDAGTITDYDKQFEPDLSIGELMQYHLSVAESFSEVFNSDNHNFNPKDIDKTTWLKDLSQYYTNQYRFDDEHIQRLTTSEATLDLSINHLMEIYHEQIASNQTKNRN